MSAKGIANPISLVGVGWWWSGVIMTFSRHTANVLAVNSTFYFCVKNPPTVSCDFSRYLSVVYQDQYSALFTEK